MAQSLTSGGTLVLSQYTHLWATYGAKTNGRNTASGHLGLFHRSGQMIKPGGRVTLQWGAEVNKSLAQGRREKTSLLGDVAATLGATQ